MSNTDDLADALVRELFRVTWPPCAVTSLASVVAIVDLAGTLQRTSTWPEGAAAVEDDRRRRRDERSRRRRRRHRRPSHFWRTARCPSP